MSVYNRPPQDGNSIDWQMRSPFEVHCGQLWDKEAEFYSKINDATGINARIKALDDWYELLKTIRRRIVAFMAKDAKESRRLRRIMSDINDMTKKADGSGYYLSLADTPLSEEMFLRIKKYLEEYCEILFNIMGENNMLLPIRTKYDPSMVW